jgi:alkylation response protein AidB-like acyl-CoA dehydrogenase
METLHNYGSLAQKRRWLAPLRNGEIRSAFVMTEPDGENKRRECPARLVHPSLPALFALFALPVSLPVSLPSTPPLSLPASAALSLAANATLGSAVASSDATQLATTMRREAGQEGQEECFVVSGSKHWISGAGDPRLKCLLVVARSASLWQNAKHKQHSVVIVPADAPGVTLIRPMSVYGFDDAPFGHFEVICHVILPDLECTD